MAIQAQEGTAAIVERVSLRQSGRTEEVSESGAVDTFGHQLLGFVLKS